MLNPMVVDGRKDFTFVLLLLFEEFYLLERYGTLAIDPLAIDEVVITHVYYF